MAQHKSVICAKCAHFVEENYSYLTEKDPRERARLAKFVHLDDGEAEYDHDAVPGRSMSLAAWQKARPELFKTYADGKIGPNSKFGPTR